MTDARTQNQKLAGIKSALLTCFLLLGFAFSASGIAAETPAATPKCDMAAFKAALAGRESNGRYDLVNSFGYTGKYQMGISAMCSIGYVSGAGCGRGQNLRTQDWNSVTFNGVNGTTSIQSFINNPQAQEDAMGRLVAQNQRAINQSITYRGRTYPPLSSYIGQTINGVTVTESGLIGAAHLRGAAGLSACLGGGGPCTDGYGTSAFEYMQKFGSYDLKGDGTDAQCKQYANNSSPRGVTFGDPRCAENVRVNIDAMVQASVARRLDIYANTHRPPMSVAQTMKVPCKSNELQRIANTFSYAPSSMGSSVLGQLSGAAGPVSGLLNNMFKADVNSFTSMMKAAGGISTDLGNFVQGQLSGLLGSLGLGDSPFASALCGLMADTLLKYIQCEAPISMPSLGNLTGSLNKLLPKGCAGDALRGALYGAASEQAFRPAGQSITAGQGGIFSGVTPLRLGPTSTQNPQR